MIGPLVVSAFLAVHVALSPRREREVRLILSVGVFGWAIDTLQATAGVFSFGSSSIAPWLCPPWLVAVWMSFASTVNVSFRWLEGRYVLAAALGAVTGPVSYYYGVKLGAIAFNPSLVWSVLVLAAVWAATMPAIFLLAKRLGSSASAGSDQAAVVGSLP